MDEIRCSDCDYRNNGAYCGMAFGRPIVFDSIAEHVPKWCPRLEAKPAEPEEPFCLACKHNVKWKCKAAFDRHIGLLNLGEKSPDWCPLLNIDKPDEISHFERIAHEVGKIVAEKNKAYGDSFANSSKVLKVLYPNGVQPEQYSDMLAVSRIIDKLFRIATDRDAFGESPYRDIAGYGVLGVAKAAREL